MQAFQRDLEQFEKLHAQVLGVSGDSLDTHRKFSDKYDISFPLIADDGQLRKLYGSGRVTYIIDSTGTVQHVAKGVPDNWELLAEIKKLASPADR